MSNCDACGVRIKDRDGIYLTGETTQLLCLRCYNELMADRFGLDFEHVEFDPVTMQDAAGAPHTFGFQTRIFSDQLALEAHEDREEGYEFSVVAPAEQDLYLTFQKLFERMRRELAHQHLIRDGNGFQVKDQVLRGQITCDPDDPSVPQLIIDGRSVTWDEFTRMVSAFEGFRFKMEFLDIGEEK